MEKKKEESPPRVPFGHPGLAIRHPLRGLGVQVIDSKSVLPVAIYNRLQFWDTTPDGFMFFQSHEDSRHSNPEGIPYRMGLFRAAYKNYGYPYHYTMDLLRHLEKDGFMQVLQDPDDSLSDDAVIAVLTKQIPDAYYNKHRDYWK